jgi:hypothetical protein
MALCRSKQKELCPYSFAGEWMDLENIILNEVTRLRRPKVTCFSHMWNIDPIHI